MNPQIKRKNGNIISRGIGWCTHTSNYIGGCFHRCRWKMPDGTIAVCYAEDTALGVAQGAYPLGFEHHYYHPEKLNEPKGIRHPCKIFMDSMSDMFGHWVSAEQIQAGLGMVRECDWHVFQSLTKNAPRLLEFMDEMPPNLWAGASSPPDFFMGKELSMDQKERMLHRTLDVLDKVGERVPVVWMSIEPLSWDVSAIFKAHAPLRWAVTGAASNGKTKYQPVADHVSALLEVLDAQGVPVWFKQNLIWHPWREYYPGFEPSDFMKEVLALPEGAPMLPIV